MIGNPLNPMMRCPNAKCGFTFCFRCRDEVFECTPCKLNVTSGMATLPVSSTKNGKRRTLKLMQGLGAYLLLLSSRFAKWAEEHTKQCPKCKSNIEKNGGCNHMFLITNYFSFTMKGHARSVSTSFVGCASHRIRF